MIDHLINSIKKPEIPVLRKWKSDNITITINLV